MAVSLTPCCWYASKVEEAARFYAGLVPNSRIGRVWTMPVETPSGPPGSVTTVEFTLAGSPMLAFSASGAAAFSNSISMMLVCDTQSEIDHLWDGLLDGGEAMACGWLKDRYGLSWQITPRRLFELLHGPDRARGARVAAAMMGMVKLDLAALEAA